MRTVIIYKLSLLKENRGILLPVIISVIVVMSWSLSIPWTMLTVPVLAISILVPMMVFASVIWIPVSIGESLVLKIITKPILDTW